MSVFLSYDVLVDLTSHVLDSCKLFSDSYSIDDAPENTIVNSSVHLDQQNSINTYIPRHIEGKQRSWSDLHEI